MICSAIKQRIAELRERAQHIRNAAQYADRTEYMRKEMAEADRIDAEANALQRDLDHAIRDEGAA